MSDRNTQNTKEEQLSAGGQLMTEDKSYNKITTIKKKKPRIRRAKITYKQSPRQKAAKLMAAEHKLMITNSFSPDLIDHENLWDIQRRNPIVQIN